MLQGHTLEDWVVCPACQGALAWSSESALCRLCGRRYPVLNGIPVLLASANTSG